MARNGSEPRKAKQRSSRPGGDERRPAAGAASKSATEMARQLDRVVQEVDIGAESLQNSPETRRGALPELAAVEVRRDRLRRIKTLAGDGILDSLQRLATALGDCDDAGTLPEPLVPLHGSARMVLDHLCHTFDVQAVYQPGEGITVTHEQLKEFDWSADRLGERTFPAEVEVVRSGWKAG